MIITSVTTRSFALEKGAFFRLLLSIFAKRMWWLPLIALTIVFFNVYKLDDVTLMIITGVLVLTFTVGGTIFNIWRYVNKKENASLYNSKYYMIDGDKISGFAEDGSTAVYLIKNLLRARLTEGHYFLIISRFQQIIIPAGAFKDAEDLQWFVTNVVQKVKSLRSRKKKPATA